MRMRQMNLCPYHQYVIAVLVVQAIALILFPESLYTFLGPGTIILLIGAEIFLMAAFQYEYIRHYLGREFTYSLLRSDGSRSLQLLRWYLGIQRYQASPGKSTILPFDPLEKESNPSPPIEEIQCAEGVAIICLPGETTEDAIKRVQGDVAAGCYPLDQVERITTTLNGHKREELLP